MLPVEYSDLRVTLDVYPSQSHMELWITLVELLDELLQVPTDRTRVHSFVVVKVLYRYVQKRIRESAEVIAIDRALQHFVLAYLRK